MRGGLLLAFSGLWGTSCAPQDAGEQNSRELVRAEARESSTPSRAADNASAAPPDTVVFLGTSLTAGYGLEDPDRRFSALIRGRIEEAGLPFVVVNAGVSGDTSAGGLARLEWVLQTRARVLVLELGANDGLRGLSLEALKSNLDAIVRTTRERYPDSEVIVIGMEAPTNLGPGYTDSFRQVFQEVALENEAHLVPFLLDGVAGFTQLNQADGIHPNVEGHKIAADNVWKILEPLLLNIQLLNLQTDDGTGER